jgi:catechol 2,3-dioxygenase-like lactoylglutathione lyase family enzyme
MTTPSLDHVGLSVADLDAQAAWYGAALGLRSVLPFELAGLGVRGVFVVSDEGWALELLERSGSRAPAPAPDAASALLTHGYGHICLRVGDLDAAHTGLLAAGATEKMAPQASPEPGVRMSFVADPEGNLIELHDRSGPVTG